MNEILTTRGTPVTVQVGARVPYTAYLRIMEQARRNGVRLSDWVREALMLRLEQEGKDARAR